MSEDCDQEQNEQRLGNSKMHTRPMSALELQAEEWVSG
jgi:hypothetical protein